VRGYLLDTHALLWWLADDPLLGHTAREIIGEGTQRIFVSAASTWEIAIKKRLGKLAAPGNISQIIDEERFTGLDISLSHGEQAGALPLIHRDPFDRILVAQAIAEGLVVITADRFIPEYDVMTMAA
jgi:PIN domain nuclease of toxin-antitoxin system